ncbi:MAG: hypothetical protein ABI180_08155 [Microcoleus sp.]
MSSVIVSRTFREREKFTQFIVHRRRKKEEGRRKKEEGRRKKEEENRHLPQGF